MNLKTLIATGWLALLMISGCAHQPSQPQTIAVEPTIEVKVSPAEATTAEPEYTSFRADTLYELLVAEIAASRNRYDVMLSNYFKQAMETRDKGVIERAVRVAQYLKANPILFQLAGLWVEVDPNNIEANQLASFQMIAQGDFEGAIMHMERVLELDGVVNFERLALNARGLQPEQKAELLKQYSGLLQRHPENLQIIYSYAVLLEVNDQQADAETYTDQLLAKSPDHEEGIIFKAQLLRQRTDAEQALNYLKSKVRAFPDNRRMGTFYARLLIDNGELASAQREFADLIERFPNVPGLVFSHALVALENEDYVTAKRDLDALLNSGHHTNEAHFYLARIAEDKDQVDVAIGHYLSIKEGSHYFAALGRAGYLLGKKGLLAEVLQLTEEARQLQPQNAQQIWQVEVNILTELKQTDLALERLDRAIAIYPDDYRLVYARAMQQEQVGDLNAMEGDLRFILQNEPENAVALNALGYTLTNKTDRHDEAFQLISKAYELKPDNPAILDSMGWVHYRLGNLELALDFLQKAYALFPDPEVASHLGEVYWVMGETQKAIDVWHESLKEHPGNELILEAMNRLGAPIVNALP